MPATQALRAQLPLWLKEVASGEFDAAEVVQRDIRKATAALATLATDRAVGTVATWLAVPVGLVETLLHVPPTLGLTVGIVGSVASAVALGAARKYGGASGFRVGVNTRHGGLQARPPRVAGRLSLWLWGRGNVAVCARFPRFHSPARPRCGVTRRPCAALNAPRTGEMGHICSRRFTPSVETSHPKTRKSQYGWAMFGNV